MENHVKKCILQVSIFSGILVNTNLGQIVPLSGICGIYFSHIPGQFASRKYRNKLLIAFIIHFTPVLACMVGLLRFMIFKGFNPTFKVLEPV